MMLRLLARLFNRLLKKGKSTADSLNRNDKLSLVGTTPWRREPTSTKLVSDAVMKAFQSLKFEIFSILLYNIYTRSGENGIFLSPYLSRLEKS